MMNNLIPYKDFHPVLYHGSVGEFSVLSPSQSDVIDGESAVFATDQRWLALAFIPKYTDDDISLGFVNGVPYLKEMRDGAFNLLTIAGFIYTVSAERFRSDPRLGLQQHEFICDVPVPVMKSEIVPNVYHELLASGLEMIEFSKLSAFSLG